MINKNKIILPIVLVGLLLGENTAIYADFCLSPNSSVKRFAERIGEEFPALEIINDVKPDPSKPVVAVFDLHGVVLEPTWEKELISIYKKVTGNDKKSDIDAWVNDNFLLHPKDKINSLWLEAKRLGRDVTEESVRNRFIKYTNIYHDYITPKLKPKVLAFMAELKKRKIPVVIVSGSSRDLIMQQIRKTQLINHLDEFNVIGLGSGSGILKAFSQEEGAISKADFYKLLSLYYPESTMVHFDDRTAGNDQIKKLGGINIGILNGSDSKQKSINRKNLIENGFADYIVKDWDNFTDVADLISVGEEVQQKETLLPLKTSGIEKLDLVMPSKRREGMGLYMDVNADFDTFTVYRVYDDSMVFLENGKIDYDAIKMNVVMDIPLGLSILELKKYITANIPADSPMSAEELIDSIKQQKYYLNYRGVTLSFNKQIDKNISIDSKVNALQNHMSDLYMQTVLEDSELNVSYDAAIKRIMLVNDKYGALGSFFLTRMPHLSKIKTCSDNIYSLRLAARNMSTYRKTDKALAIDSQQESMPYMQKRKDKVAVDYFYGNSVLTNNAGKNIDMVVGNFCTPDVQQGPEYVSDKIRNLFASSMHVIKDRKSKGIVLGVNDLAEIDVEKEYGQFFDIQLMGEPKEISLTDVKRAQLRNAGYTIPASQKTYTMYVYHLKPNQENFKNASQHVRSRIERLFRNRMAHKLVNYFSKGVFDKTDEYNYVREAFPYIYKGADVNPKLTNRVVNNMLLGKLRAIADRDISMFQGKQSPLSYQSFEEMHKKHENLLFNKDLEAVLVFSLLYSHFSEMLSADDKEMFSKKFGIDFNQSNKATADILRNINILDYSKAGLFENMDILRKTANVKLLSEFAYKVLETRGLPGYIIRGEAPYSAFSDLTDWIQANAKGLTDIFSKTGDKEEAFSNITDFIYLFNAIDMASVAEGVFDDEIYEELESFFKDFKSLISLGEGQQSVNYSWYDLLMKKWNYFATEEDRKDFLKDRFKRFYMDNKFAVDLSYFNNMLDEVPTHLLMNDNIFLRFVNFQGGYIEEATNVFRPGTQAKIIALIISLSKEKGFNSDERFFINFETLMNSLQNSKGEVDFYKVAVVETFMASFSFNDILSGKVNVDKEMDKLGSFKVDFDGETSSLKADFVFSGKASKLLALAEEFVDDDSNPFFTLALQELVKLYNISIDDFSKEYNDIKAYAQWKDNIKEDIGLFKGYVKGSRVLKFKYNDTVTFSIGVSSDASSMKFKTSDKLGFNEIIESLEGLKSDAGYSFNINNLSYMNLKAFSMPNTIVFEKMPKDETQVRNMFSNALSILSDGGRILISYNLFNKNLFLPANRYAEIMMEVAKEQGVTINNLLKVKADNPMFFAFEKVDSGENELDISALTLPNNEVSDLLQTSV